MSLERRGSARIRAKAPVLLTVGDEALPGLLRDICREAALVESPRALRAETPVALAMELPEGGGPLRLTGRVVRVAGAEGAIHPLAILFTDVAPATATRIDLFLAQHERDD